MAETKDEEDRRLPELAALRPASGGGPAASEPRLYIRANFDEMTAARSRGVAWQQIAGVLDAAGVRGASGGPLDWRQVKALFHAERYARAEAAKRAANPAPKKPRGRLRRRRAAEAPAPSPPSSSALGPLLIAPEEPEPPAPTAPDTPPLSPPPAAAPPTPAVSNPANPWAEIDRQRAEAKRRRDERAAGAEWNPYATKEKPDE